MRKTSKKMVIDESTGVDRNIPSIIHAFFGHLYVTLLTLESSVAMKREKYLF